MPEQNPISSPMRRRTWRDLLTLRPLTENPTAALVIVNAGRVEAVVAAGESGGSVSRLCLPCDLYEIDMRERILPLDLQLESRDAGRFFLASLQLVYQVTDPARALFEVENPIAELQGAILAAARRTAQVLGVEQAGILCESLVDLLYTDGALAQRAALLGLAIRRADAGVALSAEDRAFAERMQERQISLRFQVPSSDPNDFFHVRIGGVYRMRVRDENCPIPEVAERMIETIVHEVASDICIGYPTLTRANAEHALNEALRRSLVMQADLEQAGVEMVRIAAEIRREREVNLPATEIDQDLFSRLFPATTSEQPATTGESSEEPPLPDWLKMG
jgi:hypothetical protein